MPVQFQESICDPLVSPRHAQTSLQSSVAPIILFVFAGLETFQRDECDTQRMREAALGSHVSLQTKYSYTNHGGPLGRLYLPFPLLRTLYLCLQKTRSAPWPKPLEQCATQNPLGATYQKPETYKNLCRKVWPTARKKAPWVPPPGGLPFISFGGGGNHICPGGPIESCQKKG